MIKELSIQETEMVNGGLLGIIGIPAVSGLAVSVPALAIGTVVTALGALGTGASGGLLVLSLLIPIL